MKNASPKKVALVTGASSGIGAVYADRLAARGYDLILVARRADRLEALCAQISKTHGVRTEPIVADLTKDQDLARIETILSTNKDVRLLVNNAGLARLAPAAQMPADDVASQIALNITALTRLTQAVVPAFVARKQGLIINISSALAIQSLPISATYSGTKAFVLQYTRGLQQELAETGVKVQLVLPASTATEIWDASGVPLSALNKASVMTTENMVDAALAGFDQGETITWPSVADAGLWEKYEVARTELFANTQAGTPAPRYAIG
ncbi:SDR family NAD(P)-dependent oxidoreductase [Variovorax sp. Root411]|uniref:SDR family NAD(P)-dependent oxidoreductase n=1 Tax=Variovorax sp. Root411 TaxID=1736530 RepID=UPI0006FA7B14|nr:SDR family oxidoreductase [Variovorax sp. Root411]KQW61768.1 AraC family transcriptional regulator [Variovorax sp. Root411]